MTLADRLRDWAFDIAVDDPGISGQHRVNLLCEAADALDEGTEPEPEPDLTTAAETVLRGLVETFDGLAAGWRDAPFSGTNAHERRASERSFSEAAQVVRRALHTLGEATDG